MLLRIVPQALALTLLLASGATVAETPYRSTAALRSSGQADVEAALQDALGRLLVRVTGRRAAAAIVTRFPPASSIVRQYRVIDDQWLEAEFDDALVHRVLEQAGENIWAGKRPRLALWLVINDGERWLFRPAEPTAAGPATIDSRGVYAAALSRTLEEASALRGIEVDFAAQADAAALGDCLEDLWAGFLACLPNGEQPLLLLGRVAVPGALDDIEWSLRDGGLWRMVWQGGADDAVHRVTDLLAARYMATQGPIRSYLLVVDPVANFQAYARLQEKLGGLQAVRQWQVTAAEQDSLTLKITSRTAEAPLREALSDLGVPFELRRMTP